MDNSIASKSTNPATDESPAEDQTPPKRINNFDLFLLQVRSPPADPIIRYIRSFLSKFTSSHQTYNTEDQARLVQNFKLFIFERFNEYEPFCRMKEDQLWNSRVGMEKLLMTRLYSYVYSPELLNLKRTVNASHQQDLDIDSQIFANYITFQDVLTPSDFEVDPQLVSLGDNFMKISIEELAKINNFQTPRAKLVCVLNACKALIQLLKSTQSVSNADEFLPLLIYTVFKGQIECLYCNLKYIERYAFEIDGGNEVEYYLVCLSSAAEFIKNLHKEFANKLNEDGSITLNEEPPVVVDESVEFSGKSDNLIDM
ncbi:hypothetical protein WICPIJ_000761 [Wickerhamomyces pijperi]|uniref:VPS9 domain-containing protein n=1 Tax=Wickerhamomyces pijperi TaxID=599730 RepID=A0A9P8QF86_WICPI|nr:hypothetical protein WICPIJ_000761 [Wickerhamomyces pijperi]